MIDNQSPYSTAMKKACRNFCLQLAAEFRALTFPQLMKLKGTDNFDFLPPEIQEAVWRIVRASQIGEG